LLAAAGAASAQNHTVNVPSLHQNDYNQRMDNSADTIAANGCTLTAWTMVINQALQAENIHERNPDGTEGAVIQYTPAEVNTLLNDRRYEQPLPGGGTQTMNGWLVPIDAAGNPTGESTVINLGSLGRAVEADTAARAFGPGGGLDTRRAFQAPDVPAGGLVLDAGYTWIQEELAAGRPVVVRVEDDRHTVVITGWVGGRYRINDPWRAADGSSIGWLDHADYGNRVWYGDSWEFQRGGSRYDYAVPCEYWFDKDDLYDPIVNPDKYATQEVRANGRVPEPASLALVALAFLGRRKRRS